MRSWEALSLRRCAPPPSQREARGLGPLCEGAPPAGGGGESLAIGRSLPPLFCCFGVGHKQPGDQAERRQPHDDEHGAGQPAHAAAQQPPHSVEPPDAVNAPVDAADNGKQKQNLFETRHGWTLLCRRVCAEWMAFMRSRTVGAGHARPAAFQYVHAYPYKREFD